MRVRALVSGRLPENSCSSNCPDHLYCTPTFRDRPMLRAVVRLCGASVERAATRTGPCRVSRFASFRPRARLRPEQFPRKGAVRAAVCRCHRCSGGRLATFVRPHLPLCPVEAREGARQFLSETPCRRPSSFQLASESLTWTTHLRFILPYTLWTTLRTTQAWSMLQPCYRRGAMYESRFLRQRQDFPYCAFRLH